ncbi:hypothetical protein P3J6_80040 [Pseudoalteromonas sp. 3J6]|nr:hypothetical protein P3J6_80040 [Pseudoalteromonas sp. 3J6]
MLAMSLLVIISTGTELCAILRKLRRVPVTEITSMFSCAWVSCSAALAVMKELLSAEVTAKLSANLLADKRLKVMNVP